jgi:hypothetical protein
MTQRTNQAGEMLPWVGWFGGPDGFGARYVRRGAVHVMHMAHIVREMRGVAPTANGFFFLLET